MLVDYSYCNQAFIDGLKTFLDYTAPDPFSSQEKEGLIVRRRCSQKRDFEKRCIQRWSIAELINAILDNPQYPVEETTYKFALKLLSFEENVTDPSMKYVFGIAADFIDKEIINLFRMREGVYP